MLIRRELDRALIRIFLWCEISIGYLDGSLDISLTIKLNVNIEFFIFHSELDKKLKAIFVRKV